MNIWEQQGFNVFNPEDEIEKLVQFSSRFEEEREFVNKYSNLKGYEALEFTTEEAVAAKEYLEKNGSIASKFNARKDVTETEILKELDCYVKGYEEEKKKLASVIHRFYLVQKNREHAIPNVSLDLLVLDDVIFDKRVDALPDELKYALLEMLKYQKPDFAK